MRVFGDYMRNFLYIGISLCLYLVFGMYLVSCAKINQGASSSGLASLEVAVPSQVQGKYSKVVLSSVSDLQSEECKVKDVVSSAGDNSNMSLDVELKVACFPYTFTMVIYDLSGKKWYEGSKVYQSAVSRQALNVIIDLSKVSSESESGSEVGSEAKSENTGSFDTSGSDASGSSGYNEN